MGEQLTGLIPEKLVVLLSNEQEIMATQFAVVLRLPGVYQGAFNLSGLAPMEIAQMISNLNRLAAILAFRLAEEANAKHL